MTKRFSVLQRSYDSPLFLYQNPTLAIAKTISRLPPKQSKSRAMERWNNLGDGQLLLFTSSSARLLSLFFFQEEHRKIINDRRLAGI